MPPTLRNTTAAGRLACTERIDDATASDKVARVCGINANLLSSWVRLHERVGTAAPIRDVVEMTMPEPPAFVPVQIAAVAEQPTSSSTCRDAICAMLAN